MNVPNCSNSGHVLIIPFVLNTLAVFSTVVLEVPIFERALEAFQVVLESTGTLPCFLSGGT